MRTKSSRSKNLTKEQNQGVAILGLLGGLFLAAISIYYIVLLTIDFTVLSSEMGLDSIIFNSLIAIVTGVPSFILLYFYNTRRKSLGI
jgi:uncharacterized membrane protein